MSEWKPDICVYHGGCDDGFGAALAVHMRWGDSVVYVRGLAAALQKEYNIGVEHGRVSASECVAVSSL